MKLNKPQLYLIKHISFERVGTTYMIDWIIPSFIKVVHNINITFINKNKINTSAYEVNTLWHY